MTLKEVLSAAITSLSGAGLNAYLVEHLSVDENGNLLAPSDTQFVIVHLLTDPATTDFDGEAYSTTRIQVDAWAPTIGGAHDLLASAEAALSTWERQNTRSLGRDGIQVGLAADLTLTR